MSFPTGSAGAEPTDVGLAEGIWVRVCDDVLAGLSHALNNRLAAVGSLARVLEYGDPDASLRASLVAEIETLERTVFLLGLVPRTEHDGIEPLLLSDFVPPVLDLHRLRRETQGLEFVYTADPAAPPGLADPVTLTRSLLLALGPVSRAATALEGGRVVLEGFVADLLCLRLSAPDAGELDILDEDREIRAATTMMASTGGSLVQVRGPSGGLRAVELRIPLV